LLSAFHPERIDIVFAAAARRQSAGDILVQDHLIKDCGRQEGRGPGVEDKNGSFPHAHSDVRMA